MPAGPFADRDAFRRTSTTCSRCRPRSRSRSCSPTAHRSGSPPTSGSTTPTAPQRSATSPTRRPLQRTTAATEAMYLMAAHAFDVVGVRRYEWKCDSLNQPSMRAAARLGFTFEGVFRQATSSRAATGTLPGSPSPTTSGRRSRRRFERWLDPANFDEPGRPATAAEHRRRVNRASGGPERGAPPVRTFLGLEVSDPSGGDGATRSAPSLRHIEVALAGLVIVIVVGSVGYAAARGRPRWRPLTKRSPPVATVGLR